jgi:hypothetical protein
MDSDQTSRAQKGQNKMSRLSPSPVDVMPLALFLSEDSVRSNVNMNIPRWRAGLAATTSHHAAERRKRGSVTTFCSRAWQLEMLSWIRSSILTPHFWRFAW